MGNRLSVGFRSDGVVIPTLDRASPALVRDAVRAAATQAGLNEVAREGLATAASELAHNQLSHARAGALEVRPTSRDGVLGVEVIAADGGSGIRDPEAAIRGTGGSPSGLGVGLAGACRFADEVDFDVRVEESTTIRLRKFSAPVPRSEIGLFGRPKEGERLSGDDAAFARFSDGSLLLALADGLGHGSEAREASRRAIDAVRDHASSAPHDIVRLCEAPVIGSRGTVLSVVRLDRPLSQLQHAGAGNIGVHVYAPKLSLRLVSPARVLGLAPHGVTPKLDVIQAPSRGMVVMFTDGVSSKVDLSNDPSTLVLPPIVIAQRILEKYGKTSDDALILVAR